ncbi:MAG: hypothetical protein QM775_29945 [Pirellulales bacterium]
MPDATVSTATIPTFDREKPSLLVQLAGLYSELGDKARAAELLSEVRRGVVKIDAEPLADVEFYEHDYRLQDYLPREKMLAEAAVGLGELRRWADAEQAVAQIADARYRVMTLVKLSGFRAKAGESEAGRRTLDEAAALAEKIDDPLRRIEALVNVAKGHVALKSSPQLIEQRLQVVEKLRNNGGKVAVNME